MVEPTRTEESVSENPIDNFQDHLFSIARYSKRTWTRTLELEARINQIEVVQSDNEQSIKTCKSYEKLLQSELKGLQSMTDKKFSSSEKTFTEFKNTAAEETDKLKKGISSLNKDVSYLKVH
jgi:hypothetical protein